MSLISEGLEAHAERLMDAAGECITYCRGVSKVTLYAALGESIGESVDADGITVTVRSRDFIIKAEELVLDGAQTEPQRNDLIVWGERSFRVLPDIGLPRHRDSDPHGNMLRIFTKEQDV